MNLKKAPFIFLGALGTTLALGGAVALGQSVGLHPMAQPSSTASGSPAASPSPSGSPSPALVDLQTIRNSEALNYLHHIDQLQTQRGTAAQSKATSEQAKGLADALVTDHQATEQQVTSLASQKGIPLATFGEATYETAVDRLLASLSGAEYDDAFLQVELENHQQIVQRLQSLQSEVSDPDIQSLISDTIPTEQKHADLASGAILPSPSASPSGSPSAGVSPSPSPSVSASPSPSVSASASPSPSVEMAEQFS